MQVRNAYKKYGYPTGEIQVGSFFAYRGFS
jgi:hypothetical protein